MNDQAFPAQQQEPPGLTDEMQPRPDHGEDSYEGHGRLEGKRALVTGGDSGIGRAVALAFAREGADVAFTFMTEEKEDAQATTDLIASVDRKSIAIEVDLRDREACDRVVVETVEGLGGLDILVNNAGFQMARGDGLDAIDDERLDRVFKHQPVCAVLGDACGGATPARVAAAASSTTRRSRRTNRRRHCSTMPQPRPRSTTPP